MHVASVCFIYVLKRQVRALLGQPSWEARAESGAWGDAPGVSRRGGGHPAPRPVVGVPWLFRPRPPPASRAVSAPVPSPVPRLRRPGQALHTSLTNAPLTNAPLRPASCQAASGNTEGPRGRRAGGLDHGLHPRSLSLRPGPFSAQSSPGLRTLPDSRPRRFRKWAPGPWPSHCFPERAGVRSTWPYRASGEF